jgi:hypothetical protein
VIALDWPFPWWALFIAGVIVLTFWFAISLCKAAAWGDHDGPDDDEPEARNAA